jgi:diaminohydroxyphosphoribosylaminopyrimidine deaminase/5-amino-6-(5-phosphoribosylamino)uracil reductase
MTKLDFMHRALQLAEKGRGSVSPNPMVGCVITKGDRIIAEGYHEKYGGPHAEVNAIREVNGDLLGCEVYVTLEPCSHHGKTPPCADLLIERKPAKVIVAMEDPNPQVSGKGIDKLKAAGIEVEVGLLGQESRELNRTFIANMVESRSYVTAKFAQTLDGFMAQSDNESKWISGEESRIFVHKLRAEVDGIMVGSGTVRHDDPKLNVRLADGEDPLRIIITRNLEIPLDSQVLTDELAKEKTIIVCNSGTNQDKINSIKSMSVKVVVSEKLDSKVAIINLVKLLYNDYNIGHILLEGGAGLFSSFYEANLIDEIISFQAPKIIGQGLSPFNKIMPNKLSESANLALHTTQKSGDDVMSVWRKK